MKHLSFKKGIHPKYHKELTNAKPIELLLPKEELVYPMQQHIGSPCKPLVKKGDRVLVGQKIGEPTGFVGAPIHSSVSGTVKVVEERVNHQGHLVMCVVVTNDFTYEEILELKDGGVEDYTKLTNEEIVAIIKEAGLVGMGGATFPTFIKLSPPKDKVIKHIIVNGAECEPYLTSDHRVMLEEGERIIAGLKILLHMFKDATAFVGIEDNKMDAVENMSRLCEKESKIAVKVLETKYPQGSEKHLIYATTGLEVPSGKLPADVGAIVLNVDSIVAIWRAVTKGRPIMRRIVTVTGNGVKNPTNFKIRLGMSFRDVLEAAGWDEQATVKVISGGPMMGAALSSVDVPIGKGTSAILCLTEDEVDTTPTSNCIRCGKCIQACPMRLVPNALHHSALHHEDDEFKAYYGMDCIECGSCSYVCPAKRQLVQSIRTAKNRVRQK
ncbi:electron transport complex subunit RsxC [Niameybacter massiliensis]|uniref:Ion-translocating oxidoreductase complex subunit C n=1 Tax=Holtiella tumoricola TaxID=3018743 RepID=A0AA42DQZ1_9FIRM|nr:electron transport complex subunit RsxC [Holtiella tumoricola]MDA3733665.1 electron transport complex subunit RsxC [Holtiella tumoricola]